MTAELPWPTRFRLPLRRRRPRPPIVSATDSPLDPTLDYEANDMDDEFSVPQALDLQIEW